MCLMGLRTTFAVEPGNSIVNFKEILLPRNCLGGDFKGLHFVVYVASRLGQALCPERAESPAARVIKTNPTTPVVELMVEKIPFSAPFAADVTQRWIRDLARYREPRHCRSIFEIAVTLM